VDSVGIHRTLWKLNVADDYCQSQPAVSSLPSVSSRSGWPSSWVAGRCDCAADFRPLAPALTRHGEAHVGAQQRLAAAAHRRSRRAVRDRDNAPLPNTFVIQIGMPELRHDRRFRERWPLLGFVEFRMATGKGPECALDVACRPHNCRSRCGAQIRPVPQAASPLIGAPLGNAAAQVGVCPDAKPAVGLLTISMHSGQIARVGRQACW